MHNGFNCAHQECHIARCSVVSVGKVANEKILFITTHTLCCLQTCGDTYVYAGDKLKIVLGKRLSLQSHSYSL